MPGNGSGNVSNITSIGGFSQQIDGTNLVAGSEGSSIPNGAIGDFITLISVVNAGTADFFYRFHRLDDASGGAAAYQVPSGFKFHGTKIFNVNPGLATVHKFQLGTATASFTDSNATVPTGAKYQSGETARYVFGLPTPATSSTFAVASWDFPIVFDVDLFPFMQSAGGASIVVGVIGKLIAV